jgi:hypothetical protein
VKKRPISPFSVVADTRKHYAVDRVLGIQRHISDPVRALLVRSNVSQQERSDRQFLTRFDRKQVHTNDKVAWPERLAFVTADVAPQRLL